MPEATKVRTGFVPRMLGIRQLEGRHYELVSHDNSVMIENIHAGISLGSHVMKGYVESETKGGNYFEVRIRLSKGNDINESKCTCNSAHFYGNPCSHALSMRNVYVKNKKELKEEVRK